MIVGPEVSRKNDGWVSEILSPAAHLHGLCGQEAKCVLTSQPLQSRLWAFLLTSQPTECQVTGLGEVVMDAKKGVQGVEEGPRRAGSRWAAGPWGSGEGTRHPSVPAIPWGRQVFSFGAQPVSVCSRAPFLITPSVSVIGSPWERRGLVRGPGEQLPCPDGHERSQRYVQGPVRCPQLVVLTWEVVVTIFRSCGTFLEVFLEWQCSLD